MGVTYLLIGDEDQTTTSEGGAVLSVIKGGVAMDLNQKENREPMG